MPLRNSDRRSAIDFLKKDQSVKTPFIEVFRQIDEMDSFMQENKLPEKEIQRIDAPIDTNQILRIKEDSRPRAENRPIPYRDKIEKPDVFVPSEDPNLVNFQYEDKKFESLENLESSTQEYINIPTDEEIALAKRRNATETFEIKELEPKKQLSLSNPKDLQRRIIEAGFDIGSSKDDGIIGKKTVKGLQEFLISEGYELPNYGVDGKMGSETMSALESYNNSINEKKSPYQIKYLNESGLLGNCDEEQCSEFVQNEFRRRTGTEDLISLGMHGNAWDIARNMKRNGGFSVYNRDSGMQGYEGIMPGSVVTMYTGGRSNYQDRAGEGNPTHVGVVDSEVIIGENGKPYVYVIHNEHKATTKFIEEKDEETGKITRRVGMGYQGRIFRNKMYLTESERGPNVKGYSVIDIVTPSMEGSDNFRAMPNEKIKIEANVEVNDVVKSALNKVNDMGFKSMFMNDFKLTEEEYQSLSKAGLGIIGQESKFGDLDGVPLLRGTRALNAKEVVATGAAPFRGVEESRGFGRVKFNTNFKYIKDRIATDYGLDKRNLSSLVDDGTNSIIATMLVVGKHYKDFKKNEDRSPEEALYLAIQKYNRYNLDREVKGKNSYDYAKERDLDYVNKALMYADNFSSTDGKVYYDTIVDKLNKEDAVIRHQARKFNNFGL